MIKINKNLFNLNNKVVLITGVSGQLGAALAKLYLENGCKVYGIDINKCKIKHRNFYFYKKNLTSSKNTKQIIDTIIKLNNKTF